MEQTSWAGVRRWYLCPGVTLTALNWQSSVFCRSHTGSICLADCRAAELQWAAGDKNQMWGTLPRYHQAGAWREPRESLVDPARTQLSTTASRTPTVLNREQNEPRFPHSTALWGGVPQGESRHGALNSHASRGTVLSALQVVVLCSQTTQLS